MGLVTRNLAVNFLGKGWAVLMNLAFIPFIVHYLGIESYALVGVYITLSAVLSTGDFGLTITLNGELARYSVLPDKAPEMRDFVRTLETTYWGIIFCVGALVIVSAPFLASHWLRAETLSVDAIRYAIRLMGIVIAFQLLLNFYLGGLLGLQRQTLYNGLYALWFTLRFAGAVLVLWLISPTIEAFFVYQAVVTAILATMTGLLLWSSLPVSPRRPRFNANLLRLVWRFAASMSGFSVCLLLLNQADKIILSKILPLETLGYYMLAWTVGASSLVYLTTPIFNGIFPAFVQRITVKDDAGLTALYHLSSQAVSVVVLPLAVVIVVFAQDILLIWTQSSITAGNTYTLVRLLIVGIACQALMAMPFAVQIASKWTKPTFLTNLVAVLVLVPGVIISAFTIGVTGAAASWMLVNVGAAIIAPIVLHRRLLRGEGWRWYTEDVGLPMMAAVVPVSVGWWVISNEGSQWLIVTEIVAVLGLSYVSAVLAAPLTRGWVMKRLEIGGAGASD